MAKAKAVCEKQCALSPEDVAAVRVQIDLSVPVSTVARRYSVSRQTLYTAVNGRWAYAALR